MLNYYVLIVILLILRAKHLIMQRLLENLSIKVYHKTYVKDPETSELGKRIVHHSIYLIDQIGFESFTFKKLGLQIGSNESSVYRYFENKHKLLLYLSSWYWAWMEYQIVIQTFGISDPAEKLAKIIDIVAKRTENDSNFSHINEQLLNKIVINEYSKSFLTKEVDEENKEGYFSVYKQLLTRIKGVINAVNPDYKYPASLASSLVEGSLHQFFLSDHFPSITDCDKQISPAPFYQDLVLKVLKSS